MYLVIFEDGSFGKTTNLDKETVESAFNGYADILRVGAKLEYLNVLNFDEDTRIEDFDIKNFEDL